MSDPFLLNRVLLQFQPPAAEIIHQLSAITTTPDGSLWLGSDELNTIERLTLVKPSVYANHQSFSIGDFLPLRDEDEIDIEGLEYANGYLWFTGSHSPKRKQPKGKKPDKDIERLAEVSIELNRYLIARIPVQSGELVKSCAHPKKSDRTLTAAYLKTTESGNLLTEALKRDRHLGVYLANALPSKENGFDIEGLAIRNHRLFLGLRGPVLRGWAVILEVEMEADDAGMLTLKPIGKDKQLYKKHFLELNGLGIREIVFCKDDLIILAGPTMELEGEMRVFRLKHLLKQDGDSLTSQTSDNLEILFNLPFTIGHDHAEGLAIARCFDQVDGLMIVYDSPNSIRAIQPDAILADIFQLK
ncbi:MAG: DUF3616 domain-containing protein [Oscillatoriales cyanobacterium C42_A2020_001]|nr:DUF3616 domain-containing protein [Leptolyngbyaceae cyanobacterium C42_A2020_001]